MWEIMSLGENPYSNINVEVGRKICDCFEALMTLFLFSKGFLGPSSLRTVFAKANFLNRCYL